MPPNTLKPLSFKKNKDLLSNHVSVEVEASAPGDSEAAKAFGKALVKNTPFPQLPFKLGDATVGFVAAEEVAFGSGSGKVAFAAEGGVFGSLGVYPSLESSLEGTVNLTKLWRDRASPRP